MIVPEQRAEPIHRGLRGTDARSRRLERTLDHDDRKTEVARSSDLRVGRRPARVLRDQDIDGLRLQKIALRLQIERAALQKQPALGRQSTRLGRIDAPHEVIMVGSGAEGPHVLPADGEKHAARARAERGDGRFNARHRSPAVAVSGRPRLARQDQQRHVARLRRGKGVGGDTNCKRMSGIDDGLDTLGGQPLREPIGAAEAPNAIGNRRLCRSCSASGERKRREEAPIARQQPCQVVRFGRAAEDEDAHDCL